MADQPNGAQTMTPSKSSTPIPSMPQVITLDDDSDRREAFTNPSEVPRMSTEVAIKVSTEPLDDKPEFKPYTEFMGSTIQIFYGEVIPDHATIHEGRLVCNSNMFAKQLSSARRLREERERFLDCMARVAKHVWPYITSNETYEKYGLGDQALRLLHEIRTGFALPQYQGKVKKVIKDAVIEEVNAKNVKTAASKNNKNKDIDFEAALPTLNTTGVRNVMDSLYEYLVRVDKSEQEQAKKSVTKSIAHRRLYWPDFEAHTVDQYLTWVYEKQFPTARGADLYTLTKLATQFGDEALTEHCVSALVCSIRDSMRNGRANGVSLAQLLGWQDCPPIDTDLDAIFVKVVNDENAPTRLFNVVVSILASNLDPQTWAHMRGQISPALSVALIGAMVLHKHSQQDAEIHADDFEDETSEMFRHLSS